MRDVGALELVRHSAISEAFTGHILALVHQKTLSLTVNQEKLLPIH